MLHWAQRLRTAARDGPSARAWRWVTRAIDEAEEGETHRYAVAMAQKRTSGWPTELLIAPMRWWDRILLGEGALEWSLIRALRIERGRVGPRVVEELLACGASHQALHLALPAASLGDQGVELLLRWTRLMHVRSLDLSDAALTPRGVHHLLRGPLERLESLDLSKSSVGSASVEPLLQAPRLDGLTCLRLAASGVGLDGIRRLAACSGLARLGELDLSENEVGALGVEALAQSRCVSRLTALDLAGNGIDDAGARALAEWSHCERLHELDLSRNPLGERGARWLFRAPLTSLRRLDLSDTQLGPEGAAALLTSANLTSLEDVRFARTGLAPDGLDALARSQSLRRVRRLELSGNPIGAAGVRSLASSPHARALRDLELADTSLDLSAAHAILVAPLPRLRALDLSNNVLGPDLVPMLLSSEIAPRLRSLRLVGCGLDEAAEERLRQAPVLARAEIVLRAEDR